MKRTKNKRGGGKLEKNEGGARKVAKEGPKGGGKKLEKREAAPSEKERLLTGDNKKVSDEAEEGYTSRIL